MKNVFKSIFMTLATGAGAICGLALGGITTGLITIEKANESEDKAE